MMTTFQIAASVVSISVLYVVSATFSLYPHAYRADRNATVLEEASPRPFARESYSIGRGAPFAASMARRTGFNNLHDFPPTTMLNATISNVRNGTARWFDLPVATVFSQLYVIDPRQFSAFLPSEPIHGLNDTAQIVIHSNWQLHDSPYINAHVLHLSGEGFYYPLTHRFALQLVDRPYLYPSLPYFDEGLYRRAALDEAGAWPTPPLLAPGATVTKDHPNISEPFYILFGELTYGVRPRTDVYYSPDLQLMPALQVSVDMARGQAVLVNETHERYPYYDAYIFEGTSNASLEHVRMELHSRLAARRSIRLYTSFMFLLAVGNVLAAVNYLTRSAEFTNLALADISLITSILRFLYDAYVLILSTMFLLIREPKFLMTSNGLPFLLPCLCAVVCFRVDVAVLFRKSTHFLENSDDRLARRCQCLMCGVYVILTVVVISSAAAAFFLPYAFILFFFSVGVLCYVPQLLRTAVLRAVPSRSNLLYHTSGLVFNGVVVAYFFGCPRNYAGLEQSIFLVGFVGTVTVLTIMCAVTQGFGRPLVLVSCSSKREVHSYSSTCVPITELLPCSDVSDAQAPFAGPGRGAGGAGILDPHAALARLRGDGPGPGLGHEGPLHGASPEALALHAAAEGYTVVVPVCSFSAARTTRRQRHVVQWATISFTDGLRVLFARISERVKRRRRDRRRRLQQGGPHGAADGGIALVPPVCEAASEALSDSSCEASDAHRLSHRSTGDAGMLARPHIALTGCTICDLPSPGTAGAASAMGAHSSRDPREGRSAGGPAQAPIDAFELELAESYRVALGAHGEPAAPRPRPLCTEPLPLARLYDALQRIRLGASTAAALRSDFRRQLSLQRHFCCNPLHKHSPFYRDGLSLYRAAQSVPGLAHLRGLFDSRFCAALRPVVRGVLHDAREGACSVTACYALTTRAHAREFLRCSICLDAISYHAVCSGLSIFSGKTAIGRKLIAAEALYRAEGAGKTSRSPERVWTTPCGHCFHATCLARWLTEHTQCPVDRRDIPLPSLADRFHYTQ